MGTTGFTAQAAGAGEEPEVRATLQRALFLAGLLGLFIILLRQPILSGALWLLNGSTEVEALTADYFGARGWGLPRRLACSR